MTMRLDPVLRRCRVTALTVATLAGAGACGIDQGGYRDPVATPASASELVVVSGPVEGFGSVRVNGLRLATTGARIRIDGAPGTESDLRVGQVVRALARRADGVYTALSIDYEENVVGAVAAVDSQAGEIAILGQRIRVTAETRFDGPQLLSLGNVRVDDRLAISGVALPDGAVLATYVGRTAGTSLQQITSSITAVDGAALELELGELTVDYSRVLMLDVPGGVPAVGTVVEVTGTIAPDGVFVAQRVRSLAVLPGTLTADTATTGTVDAILPGMADSSVPSAVNFYGVISSAAVGDVLTIGDVEVVLTATTAFGTGGNRADLTPGAHVVVDGHIVAPGRVEARRIEFR